MCLAHIKFCIFFISINNLYTILIQANKEKTATKTSNNLLYLRRAYNFKKKLLEEILIYSKLYPELDLRKYTKDLAVWNRLFSDIIIS